MHRQDVPVTKIMDRIKIFKMMMIPAALVFLFAANAAALSTGQKAPDFRVSSGKGEELTCDMLKGRVAVLFYETKDTVEKNRPLKDALNSLYSRMTPGERQGVARISVIRCSAFMPSVWRKNLREHSKKEGITIYGDWDGDMGSSYGMKPDDSNFLVIGRDGTVLELRSGAVEESDFSGIESLITRISGEK